MLSFAISGQSLERIQDHTGLPIEFPNLRRRGIEFQFTQEEIKVARAIIHREVTKSGVQFFAEFSARCLTCCSILLETAEIVGSQPLPKPDDGAALEALLRPYFEAAVAQASLLMTMILVQFELEAFLEEFVSFRVSSDDRTKSAILTGLKMAVEPTPEVLNLVSLLELGQLVQSQAADYTDWIDADPAHLLVRIATEHPVIWERIRQYEKNFGWMGRMYFAGDPISAADIILRLQNILRYDCGERLSRLNQHREEQLAERREAIELLGDPEAQPLADIVARYMHLRSERLDAFFMAHERVLGALTAAGQALKLTHADDIIYLDWREISRSLREGGTEVAELRTKANARRKGFEFTSTGGVTEWTAPSASIPEKAEDRSSRPPADEVLAGVTACGGHIQGMVRLILTDQDMLDMAPGEILVTTMTTPSLMLAVEKASGIVTDEGGMLCHAAIVSREFDIPCVIGTGDATRRLQTGDAIDLRADEGTIHILRHAAQAPSS